MTTMMMTLSAQVAGALHPTPLCNGVFILTDTETDMDTDKICLVPNGHLHQSLSKYSVNTSTQFYTGHCIDLCLGRYQCEHTIRSRQSPNFTKLRFYVKINSNVLKRFICDEF